jgi:hypothetical protein
MTSRAERWLVAIDDCLPRTRKPLVRSRTLRDGPGESGLDGLQTAQAEATPIA